MLFCISSALSNSLTTSFASSMLSASFFVSLKSMEASGTEDVLAFASVPVLLTGIVNENKLLRLCAVTGGVLDELL